MFPIRDHNPSERTPFVTYILVAINVIIFLGQLGLDDRALGEAFWTWGVVPERIVNGDGLETLITSQFLHSGFWHIAGNMLFLWIFGDNLEDELGHIGFLIFYLASGVGAAIFQILPDPTSGIPMVGASGAIPGAAARRPAHDGAVPGPPRRRRRVVHPTEIPTWIATWPRS